MPKSNVSYNAVPTREEHIGLRHRNTHHDTEDPAERPLESTLAQEGVTVPVVIIGLLLGAMLTFSNMYFGLQTGWVTMGSLQSALLGFGLCKLLHITPFGPHENVMLQTTVCRICNEAFKILTILIFALFQGCCCRNDAARCWLCQRHSSTFAA